MYPAIIKSQDGALLGTFIERSCWALIGGSAFQALFEPPGPQVVLVVEPAADLWRSV
jgi:hypothetical protein